MSLVSLIVTVLPVVAVVAVVVVVLRSFRGAPTAGSARYDVSAGSGVWFAQVRATRWQHNFSTLHGTGSGWGQLRVAGGLVSFTPDGAQAPSWSIPASQLHIDGPAAMGTGFTVESPQLGRVTIEPSTHKMARWASSGTFQPSDYRTTQAVLTILRGWGAR